MHDGAALPISTIQRPLAALITIKNAIDEGLLSNYRDLVLAETLDDLFQQGDHLFSRGFMLAAAVIFRAVLEEKLRNVCQSEGCSPEKSRPTLSDFNTALYKDGMINKSKMQLIQSLATIGNNAAHNLREFDPDEVPRLRDGTLDFLGNL